MIEQLVSLCIFLTSGKTFTFLNVTVKHDNQTAITFTYTAMSDGQPKEAVFYKEHIAGIARLRG